jgi:hypothetical protein
MIPPLGSPLSIRERKCMTVSLLFILIERHLVKGLTAGAVK